MTKAMAKIIIKMKNKSIFFQIFWERMRGGSLLLGLLATSLALQVEHPISSSYYHHHHHHHRPPPHHHKQLHLLQHITIVITITQAPHRQNKPPGLDLLSSIHEFRRSLLDLLSKVMGKMAKMTVIKMWKGRCWGKEGKLYFQGLDSVAHPGGQGGKQKPGRPQQHTILLPPRYFDYSTTLLPVLPLILLLLLQ